MQILNLQNNFSIVEPDEEIDVTTDVTEVTTDFFTTTTVSHEVTDKVGEEQLSGPNLQAVTDVLFDDGEYQNIDSGKNVPIWRPY